MTERGKKRAKRVREVALMPRLHNYSPLDRANNTIVLVGGGGIGARVLPTLVKMLQLNQADQAVLDQSRLQNDTFMSQVRPWQVMVVDPDRVEERNLLRQPFLPGDVGEYKAVVLARRYSLPTVPVLAFPHRIEEVFGTDSTDLYSFGNPLIIGAVDSVGVREYLNQLTHFTALRHRTAYIDAGNDGNRGQVVVKAAGEMRGLVVPSSDTTQLEWRVVDGTHSFPEVFSVAASVQAAAALIPAGERAPNPACSVAVDTQTPLANNMAATLVLNYVNIMVKGGVLGSAAVTFNTDGNVKLFPIYRRTIDTFISRADPSDGWKYYSTIKPTRRKAVSASV